MSLNALLTYISGIFLVVIRPEPLQKLLGYLEQIFQKLILWLQIYIHDPMLCQAMVLAALPLIFTSFPALIYRLIQKRNLPYFIPILWTLWLLILLNHLLHIA